MVQIDEKKFENFLRIVYPNYDAMKQVVLQEIKAGKVTQNADGTIQHKGENLMLAKYVDRKYLQYREEYNDSTLYKGNGRILRELIGT